MGGLRRSAAVETRLSGAADLKLSELSRFVDAAPNIAALLDADMRYLAASSAWLSAYGLTRGIVGASHYEAFPDLPEEWKARHRRALAGESVTAEGVQFVRADGSSQWLDWNMRPWLATGSRIGGMLIFVEDVTARKAAEEALESNAAIAERAAREAELQRQRLIGAIEALPDGVLLLDAQDRIVVANAAYREAFPALAAQLEPGARVDNVIVAGARAGYYGASIPAPRNWREYLGERTFDAREPIETQSPDERWWLVSRRRTPDGGTVKLRTDITDRKRRELALDEIRSRLEHVQSAAKIGVWDTNLKTGASFANAEDRELLGLDRGAEYSYAAFLSRVHPEDRGAVEACVRKAMSSPGVIDYTYRVVRANDGAVRWITSKGLTTFDADGTPVRRLGVAIDVTELKEREAELEESRRKLALQAEEMKALAEAATAANKAKTAFVAAMSHEIRTPLNAVVGFADLIANSSDPEAIRSYVATLRGSARRLIAIVNDILDFTRLEAGGVALQDAPFDLDDLVAQAYSTLATLVGDKPISLSLVRDPGLPRALRGDADRVMQIIVNLIGNAVKFTQRGSIFLRIARLASSSAQALVRFEVIDTGPGVSDTVRARLFQAFEQGETTGTARADGTGLGLAISRRLARLMGGNIDFETEAGRGSRFWFEAPFEIAEPAAIAPGANFAARVGAREPTRPLRILVAEDTAPSRMLLRLMLERRGHSVAEAENGAAAFEVARSRCFDLILMDVQMPLMDGMDAARLIRKLPEPAASTPIVAVTADALEDRRLKCLEAGIDDVMIKPITDDGLSAVLARWGGVGRRAEGRAADGERTPRQHARAMAN